MSDPQSSCRTAGPTCEYVERGVGHLDSKIDDLRKELPLDMARFAAQITQVIELRVAPQADAIHRHESYHDEVFNRLRELEGTSKGISSLVLIAAPWILAAFFAGLFLVNKVT